MGEIMQNRYAAFRRCLALLLSVVMVLSTMTFTVVETDAESSSELSVSSWTVTIGNVTLNQDSSTADAISFTEGDDVSIYIGWKFDDVVETTENYEKDIDLGLSGIILSSQYSDTQDLYIKGEKVGEWYITSDGKLHVTLYAAYLSTTGKEGGFTIDGYVSLNENTKQQDGTYRVTIFGKEFTVKYKLVAGYANVTKALSSSVYNQDGSLTQYFTVKIQAKEGDITITNLTDTLSDGYTSNSISNITLTSSSGSTLGTYTTWDDLVTALTSASYNTLAEDDYYTITYSATVTDVADAFLDSSSNEYKNTVNVSYEDEEGTDGNKSASVSGLNISSPYISKYATSYDEASGTITWRITVYLGDLVNLSGFNADDVSITELFGDYLASYGTTENLTLNDFTPSADGKTYTLEYTTEISDAAKNSSVSVNATNTVKAEFMPGVTDGATASKTVSKSLMTKVCNGYDSATGLIKWTITISLNYSRFNKQLL